MIDFHNTVMGQKFYQKDVPDIARNLERIASALEKNTQTINGQSSVDEAKKYWANEVLYQIGENFDEYAWHKSKEEVAYKIAEKIIEDDYLWERINTSIRQYLEDLSK